MSIPQVASSGARVIRLLSVARSLEDEGEYNAAKLFRAAAFGEAVAATRDRPRGARERAQAMAAAISELRNTGRRDELTRLMEETLDRVQVGVISTLEQVPRTYVCRECGAVVLRELPEKCPSCGARPLTFQEVLPIYFLQPLDPDTLIAGLEANLAQIEEIVAGATDEQASHGEWPMREILAHLLGAERLLAGRAVRMLEEDDPALQAVAPTEIADEGDGPASISELVDRFKEARVQTLERCRALRAEEWQRAGYHPEWGRISVLQQLSYLARHEQSHLAELEQRRGEV